MNVRPEIYDAVIAAKMRDWWLVAWRGLDCDRSQARKNFLSLVRRHPEIAEENGFSPSSMPGAASSEEDGEESGETE
jgi:hypothetical protein